MLPPPPPAPMARPVAIIRSTGELAATTASSPPTSSTSPTDPAELGPNQEQMTAAAAVGLVGSACQNSVESAGRKSPARILVTPHTSREYTFAHFHSQPGQVFSPFCFLLSIQFYLRFAHVFCPSLSFLISGNIQYFSFLHHLILSLLSANLHVSDHQLNVRSDFAN